MSNYSAFFPLLKLIKKCIHIFFSLEKSVFPFASDFLPCRYKKNYLPIKASGNSTFKKLSRSIR